MSENTLSDGVTLANVAQNRPALASIDHYELVRELGGGGFATVYLARDTISGVEYAVKGLPPFLKNSSEELENIKTNFALVSRLSHTNIARAYVLHQAREVRYGLEEVRQKLRVAPGDMLMVMEYAPGVTLSQWRKQFPDRKVPIAQALDISRQIASALDYAHEQKILHRDVKPANVMIETRPDGKLVVRILDFGLAAEIRTSMGRVSREIHDTSGTRPYMAPEQWLGGKQGPETDQYALAALFHELIVGEVPFASVFETGDPVVMMNVVGREPFVAPADLPKTMRIALEKALAKKPEERFASCTEFLDAIEGKVKVSVHKVGCGVSSAQRRGGARFVAAIKGFLLSAALLAVLSVGGYLAWAKYDARAKAREVEVARIAAEKAAEVARLRQEVYELKGRASQGREKNAGETWHDWPHFDLKAKELEVAFRTGEAALGKDDYTAARVQFLKVCDNWSWLSSNKIERTKAMAAQDKANEARKAADAVDALKFALGEYVDATNALASGAAMFNAGMFTDAATCYAEVRHKFEDSIKIAKTELQRIAEEERKAEAERLVRAEAERKAREEAKRREREEAERIAAAKKAEEERRERELTAQKVAEQAEKERKAHEAAERMAAEKMASATREFLSHCNSKKYEEAGKLWDSVDTRNPEVLLRMGDMLGSGTGIRKDRSAARKRYLRAAELGNAEAQYQMGEIYNSGRFAGNDVEQDETEAVRWWRMAAEQGFAEAQAELGRSYEIGRGVEKDRNESLKWYRLAAENGSLEAQITMGIKYETGDGVGKDDGMAERWYACVERSKGEIVYFHLGMFYENGDREHAKDMAKAIKWYRKAASKGNVDAAKALKRLGTTTSIGRDEHERQRRNDKRESTPPSQRWVPGHYATENGVRIWVPGRYE